MLLERERQLQDLQRLASRVSSGAGGRARGLGEAGIGKSFLLQDFAATLKGEFCSAKHRSDWNNRRKQRGAELYDLYMAHRFDRAVAQDLKVFQAINRMASNFREEDKARRGGRKSWRAPQAVLEERPYLRSVTTHVRIGRGA